MQIVSRLFDSKPPIADDDEPVYLRPTKPRLIVRLLVFLAACVAGWALAWGIHMMTLWIRNPALVPGWCHDVGYCVHHCIEIIRDALYR